MRGCFIILWYHFHQISSDINLTHNKILLSIFISEHNISTLIVSIFFVFGLVSKILVGINWPVLDRKKKQKTMLQYVSLHQITRGSQCCEIIGNHEMRDLMVRSCVGIVFLIQPICFQLEEKPSAWYLTIAFWTTILLYSIWIATVALLHAFLPFRVFRCQKVMIPPIVNTKNIFTTISDISKKP